ncbi:allatostatin-A receptor-like [Lingula anatina]|uniref:Allatostatin-A receptor-like n=1 Tax=Lingula anatina TaxID=7574 RepID=A0A1S3IJ83_LINAN|nr:allatostatin-A receptor-like [Lingula anatina]|eukprot:XP_013398305.1 allatostatin-A receptor-like [Lingula anatina]
MSDFECYNMNANVTTTCDHGNLTFTLDTSLFNSVLPVVLCLVSVIGIIGNVLVIIVVKRNMYINCLFLNLAVADLLFILICVPIQVSIYASEGTIQFGDSVCKVSFYFSYVTMGVSIYSLVSICVLRYIGITRPLQCRGVLSRRSAIWTSGAIWAVICSINIPIIIFHRGTEGGGCNLCVNGQTEYYVYIGLVSGCDFFLPATVLPVISVLIIREVRRDMTEMERTQLESAPYVRAAKSSSTRLIVLIALVAFFFVLCWGPAHLMLLLEASGVVIADCPSPAVKTVMFVALLLLHTNSSINPLLYNFVSAEFRKSFLAVLKSHCSSERKRRRESINIEMSHQIRHRASRRISQRVIL